MRRVRLLVAGSVLAGGFLVGWLATPGAEAVAPTARVAVLRPPRLVHAGAATADAVARFAELGLAGAPEADVAEPVDAAFAPEPPPAPPPPPDVAVRFSGDLTAVVSSPEGRAVWVVDDTAPSRRRLIRPGEAYQDGWKVRAIGDQYVELARRGSTRRVSLYGDEQAGALPTPAPVPTEPAAAAPATLEPAPSNAAPAPVRTEPVKGRRLLARPKHP